MSILWKSVGNKIVNILQNIFYVTQKKVIQVLHTLGSVNDVRISIFGGNCAFNTGVKQGYI